MFKQLYSAATNVHYRNHALKLATVHSMCILLFQHALGAVQDIVAYSSFTKMSTNLFKRQQHIRWNQHGVCIRTVIQYYNIYVTTDQLKTTYIMS